MLTTLVISYMYGHLDIYVLYYLLTLWSSLPCIVQTPEGAQETAPGLGAGENVTSARGGEATAGGQQGTASPGP